MADSANGLMVTMVKDYKIIIDTCSLMKSVENGNSFWSNIIPVLQMYGKKIIIPACCVGEINRLAEREDRETSEAAKRCIAQIRKVRNYVDFMGDRGDETEHADRILLSVFMRYRTEFPLCLVTQDVKLSNEILQLNQSQAVLSQYRTIVVRIISSGVFRKFSPAPGDVGETGRHAQRAYSVERAPKSNPITESFQKSDVVTTVPETPIRVSAVPKENDRVYLGNGTEIVLTSRIAAGGEGILYRTNCQYVAKIYKEGRLTKRKYDKIQLFLGKPNINCEGVCLPKFALYNNNREFVGFLMNEAHGYELSKSVFGPRALFERKFPGWKKRDTVQLCITILEKMKYLHDRNIIMGDINPANILVVSPTKVYFVDADSYQIEGFPCPVGMVNFTAPELMDVKYESTLRSIGNEQFAVATLLFMIMLPGKPPYSQLGGESIKDQIVQMDFSYPLGEKKNKKAPEGQWRFIWSHLPYKIKEAFYSTFRRGESHATESTRLNDDDWLSLFRDYLNLLDNGSLARQDEMSVELYPRRFKKNANMTYISCKICGDEFPEEYSQEGICRDCLNKGTEYSCADCGTKLFYSNYEKYIKGKEPYKYCRDCAMKRKAQFDSYGQRQWGNTGRQSSSMYNASVNKTYKTSPRIQPRITPKPSTYYSNCAICGCTLSVPAQTYLASNSKEFVCESCYNKHSLKKKKRGCFITTAVCEYRGLPDNCYELQMLRYYRDVWLKKQSDGPQLIQEYYLKAPQIVEKLKSVNGYEDICEMLWNQYIMPCVRMIECGDNEQCRERYIEMVRMMEKVV